jgi:site-specific DNA-methyltransferase (adenine-specific)
MLNLYNGDCLDFLPTLADESVDLLVTDPPYRTTARGSSGNSGGMLQYAINKRGLVFEHNDIEPQDYAPECYRILKDGSHCYVMTNHVNLISMLNSFTEAGFHFIKSLIWKKDNRIMGKFYMSQFEYILFFRKGRGVQINNCGTSDVLEIPNIKYKGADGANLHDTEKPVELMRILIENSSQPNDVVCDPFMGIGATGVACQLTGRSFIGVELDQKYFSVAEDRIHQADISDTEHTSDVSGLTQQFRLF